MCLKQNTYQKQKNTLNSVTSDSSSSSSSALFSFHLGRAHFALKLNATALRHYESQDFQDTEMI